MPIYTYRCSEGHDFDRFLKLDDYKEPQICDCGANSQKVITPTMINCDMQPWDRYESPCSGKIITSYKDRKNDMERHGCVDYDPGVRHDSVANQKREDIKMDKAIDHTVEEAFEKMPIRKKEKLENDLKYTNLEYQRASV